jgi:hypothetical protein
VLKAIPDVEITADDLADVDRNITCAICLDDYQVRGGAASVCGVGKVGSRGADREAWSTQVGDKLKRLPCRHEFHATCILPWFDRRHRLCPTCKRGACGDPYPCFAEAPCSYGCTHYQTLRYRRAACHGLS